MAINFIKKEDLSHITRTTRQWETTIDRYEIIPKGVLCIELCNDKLTKIKIGNGHLIYEQLPYVSDVNLSDYYTKEETNNLIKNLKSIKIKGEASSLSDLPSRGNEEGDLWFVKKQDPETRNRYDEYVWYNNKWESFGSSDIDLSEYAKKSYVDTHIQEVQNEITEIIESGYLHKHDNKNILDHTSAVYNVEKDNKLRDLHNYDDTELREKAHTHLNKNILDQTDAVYNRDKDDKLELLHNYDDTSVKQRLSSLESVSHSHSNLDVLNRTTAAFTKEQALTLLDCKDFKGTDGVHDGYHGFVPAPTKDDVGKVLGANGQWVEGGSSGGDVVTQGGGISITTDAQTGNKVISVNAGTGLEIDQQTGELNVTATGGDSIAEGGGISIETDQQTGVKTISVNVGDNLEVDQVTGELNVTGVDYEAGNGIRIGSNYNFLEYIKNSGNYDQIITTDITPLSTDKIELDVKFGLDTGLEDNLPLFGVRNTAVNPPESMSIFLKTSNPVPNLGFYNHFFWTESTGNVPFIENPTNIANTESNQRQILTITQNLGTWGTQSTRNYSSLIDQSYGELTTGVSFFGYVYNTYVIPFKTKQMSLYGVKIYNSSDVLIHDLRPVERVSDNAAGLYDVLTNKFYGNAGSGSFVKGPVITTPDRIINAKIGDGLQFDSNNAIEVNVGDGLSINANDEVELDKATTTTIGGVIVGNNLSIDNTGTISADEYTPGEGISIDSNKEVSVKYNSDGLSINASDELELDKATTSAIGGVIVGDNIDVNNGTISVPKAASNKLGVVKPSNGLSVDSNGVLTVDTGDGLSIDSTTKEVNVNVGDGLSIDSTTKEVDVNVGSGLSIDINNDIVLDPATDSTLGGVIVSDGLSVESDGTVSVNVGHGLSINQTTGAVEADADPLIPATESTLGGVIVGSGINVSVTGNISINAGDGLTITRSGDLPSGYSPVLGIKSTSGGNQYINTGYLFKANSVLKITCKLYKAETDTWIIPIGMRTSGTADRGFMFATSWGAMTPSTGFNTPSLWVGGSYQNYPSPTEMIDEFYNDIVEIQITATGLRCTNTRTGNVGTITPGGPFTGTATKELYVFAANDMNNGADFFGPMDVYSLEITEDNTLVRQYVPCKRTLDDKYGLYDMVNEQFKLSPNGNLFAVVEGATPGSIGEDILNLIPATDSTLGGVIAGDGLSVENDGTLSVNTGDGLTVDANNNLKAKIGVGLHFNEENAIEADEIDIDTYEPGNGISFIRHYARELPTGYTQLEYIESRFDAGFILDYYPQKTSRIVCEAAYVDINRSTPSDNCLFGSRNGNSSSSKQFVFWFNNKTSDPCYVGFVYSGDSWSGIGEHYTYANMHQRLLFEISPSIGVYCNNVLIQNPLSHPDYDPSPYKLGILCLATSDTGIDTTRNYQSGRIFTFKIYESDTLVVDLVPCLNDSDVPGLYDMVGEVFYPSASGTDFTYDPDAVVTHDSITIDANRGPGIIYDNNALSLNPGAGLSIDVTDNQKLNVNLADGLSIKNTSTNAIKINTGDGLSVDSTTNNLNVNIGDGLVKDSSNNIDVNLYENELYIKSENNQIRINPLYAPTYEAGNGVQFVSTSPYSLPPNYTKLSCVESKNTSSDKSAFRLNYVPTTETKFDVLFGITKTSFSNVTIIGSGGSNTAKYSLNITRSSASTNNTTVRFYYCQDGSSTTVSFTTAIGDILHIVADKNGVYVNNNLVQTPIQTGSPSSYKLCVGSSPATNSAGSFSDPSTPGKYYDIKIYEGNTLTVHLIPCLNDSNVPGMYDEVNELFHHNEWKTDFHYDENEKTRPGYYVQAKLGNGLQFDANNAIEVVNSGTEYTAGDGIDIDSENEISVKIGNHLSFDQTTGDINVDDIIAYYGGAATEVVNSAEFTIDKIRWNVSAIRSNSGSEIWIQLRYFGFYDDSYNRFQVSSGVSTWSDGSTVEYYQNRTIESLIANTERLCAKTWNGIRSFAMTFNLTYDISSDDLKYFRYYTGDDESGRDPVSWTIEVHDKEADTWTQVQTVTGATVPTGRNQWTSYFDLNLPPSDGKKINVLAGDGLFIDSTNNDVNVKIGQALSINNSNEIDVNLGRALSINNSNEIDVDIATANSLGVVKAGSGLNIDEFGNLSTQAAPFRIGRALSLDDESVRLPSGYAKAKYVENPDNAGIRTGFRPSDYPNAKYTASVSVESVGSSQSYPTRYLCGASGWAGSLSMPLDGVSNDLPIKTYFHIGNGNYPEYTTTAFQLGERFDFEASPAGGFKINNELVQAVATPPSNFGTYFFTLFGSGASNGTGEPGFKGRIYYFRIYNTDDTLLANFVPAVRLGDNVVGFFNTVNNTFYSSETSTAFTTDMDDLDVDDPDWVLNANIATSNSLGVVKPSTGLVVNEHGALTLDKASTSTIGGVKVGNNLSIDSNGVLSANIVNYSAGHAIEIVGDLSIDKFRWEITANAGDSMVAFRYFEYSDSDHIAFTIQNGTIEWSDGSTVSYPSGYDETFTGMMENRTKCTVTGWGGSKTLIMTFTLSQSIMMSDIAYFRWKTDDYMGGRQPTEFNIYAHDSVNDEWILLKEVTDHSLVPSSSNTWSNYIEIEPEIEPGSINVKYGNGLTLNQNNELEVPIASSNTLGIVKIGHGVEIDPYGAINVEAMVPFVAGVGLELIPGSSSVDALPEGYGKVDYIETNGSAYTIINYVPNRNSKVVGTAMFRTDNSDPVVFGCRKGGGNGQQFVLWFDRYSSAQAKVGFVYGTNTWSTSTDANDGRLITYTTGEQFSFLISVDDDCNINNTFVHNITNNGAPASDLNLGIFALAVTNSSIESDYTIFNGRMYDFKIYENDELVVNLVPAVRLEDTKVGFYDNINDVFYTSFSSSNQFTTDISSMVIDYQDTTLNVRLGEGLKTNASNDITLDLHAGNGINIDAYGSVLPAGYGELSYIEGNGNQWTQLNYYPTHDSRLVVDCISYETHSTDRALFGCREGTGGQPQFVLWMGQKTTGYVTSSFVYGSNVWDDDYDTGVAVGERFTIDASYNGVYINGDLFESITDQGNMPNLKVALFTVGNGDGSYISGKGMGKYRIFSFKIYEGNDLVVDLRPALSPNRIPGFYDVVNDEFYSSLTGTAFVYDSGSIVYPSGLQITTKLGDGLAYDVNGAITLAESVDAFVAGDGIKFTNLSQANKIKLVISAIRSTSQSGANAPYTQMRYIEFYDENLDPITIASGEAIWSDGTTVVYSEQIYSLNEMLSNTNKMCVCDYKPSLVLTFTLSSAMSAENIKYFRYKTGNDVSERDPVSWKIYVNDVNAQTSWTQISEAVSETITTSRDTWTQYFTCEFTAGGTTSISVRPATGSTLGGVIVGNGLTVTSDGTISTATGKAYIAGEGINMSSSQYEFSAENEQYLFKSQVTCELHGDFNREFQKYTDDTALGIIWNVYDSGTLWSGPIFVGLSSDAVKYTTNSTTYSALGTFSYLGKTWYYSDHSMYVSNIDGTDYDGNMVVDTETSTSTSELVDFCKSLIDRARVILKVDEISLLPATEDTLGGIKIGEGLSIDENNVVSSTVYEEGQGIIFETSGSTDSFDVKNKQYYFDYQVNCQLNGNFGPRTYTRVSTDEPCIAAIIQTKDANNSTIWTNPILIGLTETACQYTNSYDQRTIGPNTSFSYKGYTWYVTADYGLMNSTGVDLNGHLVGPLDFKTYSLSDSMVEVSKTVIDLAELISPGIKTYDVWNTGTGWLNGSYADGTSDTFYTNWYKEYHSNNTVYFELPKGATHVKLTSISTSDTAFGGNHIDLFNDAKHHIGTFTGESQWHELLTGTVYLQFGVKWNEQNTQDISGSQVKSVTLEIKVPKNNAITAKLGDGLTFDEDDAITLDESIKLIIHCVGDPLT